MRTLSRLRLTFFAFNVYSWRVAVSAIYPCRNQCRPIKKRYAHKQTQ